jgi:hypothetical protein
MTVNNETRTGKKDMKGRVNEQEGHVKRLENKLADITRKVEYSSPFMRAVGNFLNRFRTFQRIGVEEYSDEWFLAEMGKRNPVGTICESHRLMFRELKRSYVMAKKMAGRLEMKMDRRNYAKRQDA